MNDTLTICTSKHCIYRDRCCRQTRSNPDDVDEVSYNYEYTCCPESGFEDFILDTTYAERNK